MGRAREDRQSTEVSSRTATSSLDLRPTPRGVVEGVLAAIVFSGVAAFASLPLGTLVVSHPYLAVGAAAAGGSILAGGGLALIRYLRQSRPVTYEQILVPLPHDPGEEPRSEPIAIVNPSLTWIDLHNGVQVLHSQLKKGNWTPNLVVMLNQGDIVTGLLRAHPKLRGAKFGSIILDSDRAFHSIALPVPSELSGPARVLLVDYQLKKGSAVAAALKILEQSALHVKAVDVRVAIIVVGQIFSIPRSGRSVPLSDEGFRPEFDCTPEAMRDRVARVYYVAFVCTGYPRPPWSRE